MIFTFLLLTLTNGYLIYANKMTTSISTYLSLIVFLSLIGYLVSFVVGIIRVAIDDRSFLLSKLFEHVCVDVYMNEVKVYFKYNILPLIVIVACAISTLYLMKGAI